MAKKMLAICAALVAFAVVPAVASASPILTDENGTVAAGAKIIATNTGNTVMTTSAGNVECTKAALTGTVVENSGSSIKGTIETASFTGTESENRCSSPFGAVKVTPKRLHWCMSATSKPADTFSIKSGGCGGTLGIMEFTLDSSLAGECTYTKSEVVGTFTTGEGGDVTVSEQSFTKSSGGFFCPASGALDMTFDLYTDGPENEELGRVWVS